MLVRSEVKLGSIQVWFLGQEIVPDLRCDRDSSRQRFHGFLRLASSAFLDGQDVAHLHEAFHPLVDAVPSDTGGGLAAGLQRRLVGRASLQRVRPPRSTVS